MQPGGSTFERSATGAGTPTQETSTLTEHLPEAVKVEQEALTRLVHAEKAARGGDQAAQESHSARKLVVRNSARAPN